ncbi:MAG: c-type cytochrome [Gammaproteobacteria bacterium]|nr:c-type cytochrome [Gammaproteobacteria bacterium]
MFWNYPLVILVTALYAAATQAAAPEKVDSCNACHAAENQLASKAPALAGQQQQYLKKQLQQFQSAERGAVAEDSMGQVMAAMAKPLSAEDIDQLSTYFSALPVVAPSLQQTDAALLDKGRRIYIGSCGACHGNKAQGNLELKAPALQLLSRDYLLLQLQHFQSGVRGSSATDKPGRQMAMMSRTLTEADRQAVVAYIGAGLP